MSVANRIKKRNLYKIFQKKFIKCINSITRKANKVIDLKRTLNQLIEDGFIEVEYISSRRDKENRDVEIENDRKIVVIKQKKEIKKTPAIWLVFDRAREFEEIWYHIGPFVKQRGYIFIVAIQPASKNKFVSKVLLGNHAQLTLYSINEFAPTVESYKTSLEISLQKGAKLNYSSFTTRAPRIFESLVRIHGSKDTVINFNSHFCNTKYYTTRHQWILSKNSRINISLSGIVGAQSTVELNDEFICTNSSGEIYFKTDILKISPLANVTVRPTISIGSTASYNENINITHFKKEYFNYFSRLGFEKDEILDLLVYSYLEPTKFIRGCDSCSQFLIL